MTSLCRNLTVLLLFLSASPLLPSYLFTHATTTSPRVTLPRINIIAVGSDSEYEGEYDDPEVHSSAPDVVIPARTTLLKQAPRLCEYNSCLEDQEPCTQLFEKTGCLCPGFSRVDEPPHAPRIHMLQLITKGEDRGKVEVQWCAPSSEVSTYRVVVQGSEEDAQEFQPMSRKGLVGSLEAGTKVCVEAVNKAGSSSPSEFSCRRYSPPESSDHQLWAGVIGGGVALVLLLIVTAILLWKFKICQKAKRDSTDGLGNPSYSTEGTL